MTALGPTLILDAGDFCGVERKAYGFDTEVLLDMMKMMGYDVATVGEFELRRGLEYTKAAGERGGFEIVSANIFMEGPGEVRPFPPYTIKKIGRRRFGIIGVIGNDDPGTGNRGGVTIQKQWTEEQGIVVTDALVAIKDLLPEVQKQSDVVIVLAHTGLARAKEIAARIPEIDVVITGHGSASWDQQNATKAIVVQSGGRSEKLGVLRMVSAGGEITDWDAVSYSLNQDTSPFNAAVRKVVWDYLELDEHGNRVAGNRKVTRDTTATAAAKTVPDEPVDDTASRINMRGDHFLGVASCKDCHVGAWAQWSRTGHATAYETLASTENDWNNHECLPCHTTGYGESGGHTQVGLTPELWNVQCEECHGMGTLHSMKAPEVVEASCLRCHTEEQDPDFDFARDIVAVLH